MTPDDHAQLFLRLAPGFVRPHGSRNSLNDYRGGPEVLLEWLECQLGLPAPRFHRTSRISELATALDAAQNPLFADSLRADRWATASELLTRWDELRLAGWDGVAAASSPPLVRALAEAVQGRVFQFPDEAERLERVLAALDGGQVLPRYQCLLHDAVPAWPAVWQRVLAKLSVEEADKPKPAGSTGSVLNRAQAALLGGNSQATGTDASFRQVRTRSDVAAVEFVAATLAQSPDKLSTTVIICEDDDLAVQLDACLDRIGLPTSGASSWSRAHPVLQVLPLSLALCWSPVDPEALLAFLTLPVLPLPRSAAAQLANALTREPGLGSGAWAAALEEICGKEADPEGELRARLKAWLEGERVARGEAIPSRLVRIRCGMVAQWAAGRANLLVKEQTAAAGLVEALQVAAGQAALLGELAECQGQTLSEPQLNRLLEEVLAQGVETQPFLEADGGPIRVRSLSEMDGPCDRLIWLGLGTGDARGSHWSAVDQRDLRATGVFLDDGSRGLSSLRDAETRGFCQVQEAFLAVLLPGDLEKRWHPLWLAARVVLPQSGIDHPPVLEDLVMAGDSTSLAPFGFECHETDIKPPPRRRPLWNIPAGLLRDRETVSATELQDRLACPLKWTLGYQAQLRPGSMAKLPEDHQLKGTFCHSLFERVLGAGGELPSVDVAEARMHAAFDERLPLDAAPLAQQGKQFDRDKLRRQVGKATRFLVHTLASGGYRIIGLEVELTGEALGKPLKGSIDCLVRRDNGEEAVIDFKYSGRAKYHSLIAEGKAVQLATYAYGRSLGGRTFPAVAYLVLADGLLYTPEGSPIHGDTHQSVIHHAPAIQTVWREFSEAIGAAADWMTPGAAVPARPLQEPPAWPAGATLVLETQLKPNQVQAVCQYCDFQRICGLQETL